VFALPSPISESAALLPVMFSMLLLELDAAFLRDAPRWDASRDGMLLPHLHGVLSLSACIRMMTPSQFKDRGFTPSAEIRAQLRTLMRVLPHLVRKKPVQSKQASPSSCTRSRACGGGN
jgi:hypothetical protein